MSQSAYRKLAKMRSRIIPVLLLKDSGLYKTRRFRDAKYIGDPVNCVRIFNDKEVDELGFLDIGATIGQSGPDFELLEKIAGECFMPLSYGGGVTSIDMVRKLISIGFEKVVLNTAAFTDSALIPQLVSCFGTSTIVGSIDVRRNWLGREGVYIRYGTEKIPLSPEGWAMNLEALGVGELLVNSINRDGIMEGYDFDLIERVSNSVSIPVIACGGASKLDDFRRAISNSDASAVAAG